MSNQWNLITPKLKIFLITHKSIVGRAVTGVDEDGSITTTHVDEEVQSVEEVEAPATIVRLQAVSNDTALRRFHIRIIYGRLDVNGQFEASIRDDGILISGPNYDELDTNEDGLISEEEIFAMSAELLKWDGEMVEFSLPHEGEALA